MKAIKRLVRKELKNHFFLYVSLFLLTLLIFALYRDYGVAWDESDNIDLGSHAYSYYRTFAQDKSFFSFYPQQGFYVTRGPFVEVAREAIMRFLRNRSMETYHLILALFSLSAFFFLYKISHLLTGKRWVGLLSVILLFATPRFFGDIFNNSKDIAPVYFLMAATYFSLMVLRSRRVEVSSAIFFGAAIGIGVSMRVVLLYALGIFFLIYMLNLLVRKVSFSVFLVSSALILFASLLSLHLVHPYLHEKPFAGILDMITYSTRFPQLDSMLFDGSVIRADHLPWYYLPKWILITTPLSIVFFAFFSLIGLFRRPGKIKKLTRWYIALLFFVPIALVIISRPYLYDAWRHFLFLIAPFSILAVIGLYDAIRISLRFGLLALGIFLIGSAATVITMQRLHPYEYVYFSSLVGGLKGAYGKYETDYWGKSFKEAVMLFEKRTAIDPNRTYTLNTCGHPSSSIPYFLPNMKWVGDLKEADYFICYTRYGQHKLVSDEKTLYTVDRDGIPLNFVKRIK